MSDLIPLRRKDKMIGELEELHRILDEAEVLRMAMIDEGRPYVVPLNFAREGDDLWIHCASEGRKLRCLRRDETVCVEVDRFFEIVRGSKDPCAGWTTRYESVIGFGAAEIVVDDRDKLQGLETIMRRFSGRGDWVFSSEALAETTVIRVRLESLTGKRSAM